MRRIRCHNNTALTSGPWVSASTRIPAMIPAEQTAEMTAVTRSRVQPGHFSSGDTVILTPHTVCQCQFAEFTMLGS